MLFNFKLISILIKEAFLFSLLSKPTFGIVSIVSCGIVAFSRSTSIIRQIHSFVHIIPLSLPLLFSCITLQMNDTEPQPPVEEILGGDHVPMAPSTEGRGGSEAPGSLPATEPQAAETPDPVPPPDMELLASEQGGVSLPEKRPHGGLESLAEQLVETDEIPNLTITQILNPPLIELRRGGEHLTFPH